MSPSHFEHKKQKTPKPADIYQLTGRNGAYASSNQTRYFVTLIYLGQNALRYLSEYVAIFPRNIIRFTQYTPPKSPKWARRASDKKMKMPV